jgi:hypothetical protein
MMVVIISKRSVTGGDEGERGQRFVKGDVFVVGAAEAAFPFWIGAKYVVINQQMGDAQRLDPLSKRLDVGRIRANFVMREHCPQLHTL